MGQWKCRIAGHLAAFACIGLPAWSTAQPPDAASAAVGQAVGPMKVLVIVHTEALDAAAAAWEIDRTRQGWTVHRINTRDVIATATQRGSNPDGAALREAIRGVIRRMFSAFAPDGVGGERFAVLLLGDAPDHRDEAWPLDQFIPTWYRAQHNRMLIGRDGITDIATDHDYQLADDEDDLPDYSLGRIPARTSDEAMVLLEKIRRYESGEGNGGAWRKHLAYFASEGRFGALDAVLEHLFIQMVDQIVPYSFDVSMAYAKEGSPYAPPPDAFTQTVLDRINHGALLVTYLGHGQARTLDRWYVPGRSISLLSAEDVTRIRPLAGRHPIMLFVACWTGQFDRVGGERSLAEELLFTDGGAIGVVAGSRITHPLPSGVYQRHFTDALLNADRPTLGNVDLIASQRLAQGDAIDEKLDLLALPVARMQRWDTSPAELRPMHMSLYNVLGDPTLAVAVPRGRISALKFAMDQSKAEASGSAGDGFAGVVTVTIELRRSMLAPHEVDDARRRDERANDKVLLRESAALGRSDGGRFRLTFDRRQVVELGKQFHGQLVIKVAALGAIKGQGPVEAVDHLLLSLER